MGRGIIPAYAGSTFCRRPCVRWRRIIPAYAGSTPDGDDLRGAAEDHPRIRGEHAPFERTHRHTGASSPHTRGARELGLGIPGVRGIIPAYAGSTRLRPGDIELHWDHPRIRGEHVSGRGDPHEKRGSSPHTRGALANTRNPLILAGIIPAYAGSTLQILAAVAAGADHPRIRGEHAKPSGSSPRTLGSSPHTRGARFTVCC